MTSLLAPEGPNAFCEGIRADPTRSHPVVRGMCGASVECACDRYHQKCFSLVQKRTVRTPEATHVQLARSRRIDEAAELARGRVHEEDNMFVPLNVWNQFGANAAGSGYRLVNTTSASAPGWAANLPGPTGTSSPVLGPDGTIYIGTTNGRLVALHPNYQPAGQIKWAIQILVSPVPYYDTYAIRTPRWPMMAQSTVSARLRPSSAITVIPSASGDCQATLPR